jgi:tetratricopeptide (TPR) repeat protein
MVNLAIREKRQKPTGANFTVDCYFDRAIRFKPDDPTVRMVYGLYLHKLNKIQPAIKELVAADQLRPNDANINYNLGLLYFDTKDYEKAMQRAKRAYALGFGLSGLKIKLQRVGKWSD